MFVGNSGFHITGIMPISYSLGSGSYLFGVGRESLIESGNVLSLSGGATWDYTHYIRKSLSCIFDMSGLLVSIHWWEWNPGPCIH